MVAGIGDEAVRSDQRRSARDDDFSSSFMIEHSHGSSMRWCGVCQSTMLSLSRGVLVDGLGRASVQHDLTCGRKGWGRYMYGCRRSKGKMG